MSYGFFLILFIGVPLVPLFIHFLNSVQDRKSVNVWGIFTLCLLAFCYTTPWDNYLVANKVWWYGADRVLGVIGYVPFEEYCFFIFQTIMTGLWCFFLQSKITLHFEKKENPYFDRGVKLFLMTSILLSAVGLFFDATFYLSLILVWALPILLLQFFCGSSYLFSNSKIFWMSSLTPTVYLWVADFYAISDGIWEISSRYTLGLKVGVLPIEEMIFFLVTNLMVVQGLLLFNLMKSEVQIFTRKIRSFV